jgi:hypothetical protein
LKTLREAKCNFDRSTVCTCSSLLRAKAVLVDPPVPRSFQQRTTQLLRLQIAEFSVEVVGACVFEPAARDAQKAGNTTLPGGRACDRTTAFTNPRLAGMSWRLVRLRWRLLLGFRRLGWLRRRRHRG